MGGDRVATKTLPSFPFTMMLPLNPGGPAAPPNGTHSLWPLIPQATGTHSHLALCSLSLSLLYANADTEISPFLISTKKLVTQDILSIADFTRDLGYKCGLCYRNAKK